MRFLSLVLDVKEGVTVASLDSNFPLSIRRPGDTMAIFKKHSLKISDKKRTRAAELTLRESIYPICLVTILFFLWVRNVSGPTYEYISDSLYRASRMVYSTR